MTRAKNFHTRPVGHVRVPAAMIGGLSMMLAGGLAGLGLLSRMNAEIARIVSRDGAESFPQHLPQWCIWLATALLAFGLAAALLGTPGHGRRAILWFTTVVLVAAWAPVLSLAARAPDIGAPWVATLWSGICALVYAANHRMACDGFRKPQRTPTPTATDDPR